MKSTTTGASEVRTLQMYTLFTAIITERHIGLYFIRSVHFDRCTVINRSADACTAVISFSVGFAAVYGA